MAINKNAVGRPSVITMKKINKIADLISHNYSVSDSARYAGISKATFYRYLKSEPIFKKAISTAYKNQNKVSFNFETQPWLNK